MLVKTRNVLYKDGITFDPVIEDITSIHRLVKRVVFCELSFGARIDSMNLDAREFCLITKVFGNTDVLWVTLDTSHASDVFLELIQAVESFSQWRDKPLTSEALTDKLMALGWLGETSGRVTLSLAKVLLDYGINLHRKIGVDELSTLLELVMEGLPNEDIQLLLEP